MRFDNLRLKSAVAKGLEQEWFCQSFLPVILFVLWLKSVIPE